MFLSTFLDVVNKRSDRSCFFIKGQEYKYGQLKEAIIAIKYLIERVAGTDKKEHVAIMCSDDFYMYASLFAIWFSGKSYVPLGFDNPVERNLSILHEANCKVVISTVELDSSDTVCFR